MDLPLCNGHNAIFTCVDWLTEYCGFIHCLVGKGALITSSVAKLLFYNMVRFFGVPAEVISDRDPRFTASFWYELWALLGTKLLMSSAYYPQTDG